MKITRLQTTTTIGMAALGLAALPILPVQTSHAAPPAGATADAAQSATADIYIIQVSGRG
jgi:hypothetical protein